MSPSERNEFLKTVEKVNNTENVHVTDYYKKNAFDN
jgi:hypothetical protein